MPKAFLSSSSSFSSLFFILYSAVVPYVRSWCGDDGAGGDAFLDVLEIKFIVVTCHKINSPRCLRQFFRYNTKYRLTNEQLACRNKVAKLTSQLHTPDNDQASSRLVPVEGDERP